jgi:hypothetical protein
MTYHDLYVMLILGVGFLVLGVIGILWGKKEEGSYYGSLSEQIDVREYVDRSPTRPEPIALKIGGRIAIAVGLVLLVVGLAFFLWGMAPIK